MDVLFDLRDGVAAQERSVPVGLVGAMTRPLAVTYEGRIDLFGIRFRPGGAAAFVDCAAWEITDRIAPLDQLWGGLAHRIRDRLAQAGPGPQRARIADRALAAARNGVRRHDERVLAAAELITAHRGRLPVSDVARIVGLGRRQLERRYRAVVGLSPKTSARVARFRSVVDGLHADPSAALSTLALRTGYADQAHMTRDFSALAGCPPGVYRARLAAR